MNIDIIVQARTGSTRLPGKVLMPIMGRRMIEYTWEAVCRCHGIRTPVLAIPRSDLGVLKICPAVHAGDENDVASRFIDWVEITKADAFVRICGDSPVIDWRLVDNCIDVFKETGAHLVSNVGGGFPHGQQVEVIDAGFFLANRDKLDREHVTPTLYDLVAPEKKRILLASPPSVEPSLVVDTREDFDRLTRVIEKAGGKPWEHGWRELQEFAR